MTHRRYISWLFAVALVASASAGAMACKYSVRDVAFVDLGADPYLLRIHLPSDADRSAVSEIVRSALAGSNVRHELVIDPPVDAIVASLVAPDGRELSIPIESTRPDAVRRGINSVVNSPLARRLLGLSLSQHSVVLVVHGSDANANASADLVASNAARAITNDLDRLPKPIDKGPTVVTMTAQKAAAERVLLFSLGIRVDRAQPTADIAVVYGRLRRLGPVLSVPPTHAADLTANMNFVGQDCECELDRAWMTGPMVPHVWSDVDAQRAADALDFDPGSPLVHTEIRQILARGPSDTRRFDRIGQPRAIDPLLGYTETEIEPSGLPESREPPKTVDADPPVSVAADSVSPFEPAFWTVLGIGAAVVVFLGIRILLRART